MKIISNDTPTSELTQIRVGDQINNGFGIFGEVESIFFEDHNDYWQFTFALIEGGYIEARKLKSFC